MEEALLDSLDSLLHTLLILQSHVKTSLVNFQQKEQNSQSQKHNTETEARDWNNSPGAASFFAWSEENDPLLDRKEFFRQFSSIIQSISKECTKFSLAFTQQPYPSAENGKTLCESIKICSASLTSLYLCFLPKCKSEFGDTCWQEIRNVCLNILISVGNLIISVKSPASKQNQNLRKTGTVWEACDRALESLPRNNRSAVLAKISEVCSMVQDGLNEMQELVEENDDSALGEKEKATLLGIIGLIKTSKASSLKFQKCLTAGTEVILEEQSLAQLDKLNEKLLCFSPQVDNLVAAFYSVQEDDFSDAEGRDQLAKEAERLKNVILEALNQFEMSSAWIKEEDMQRVTFLKTAVEHNLKKLIDAIST